jgi:hypothetical protein
MQTLKKILLAIAVAGTLFCGLNGQGNEDLVRNLPGLIFETNFDVYAGYLWADTNNQMKMFYWSVKTEL